MFAQRPAFFDSNKITRHAVIELIVYKILGTSFHNLNTEVLLKRYMRVINEGFDLLGNGMSIEARHFDFSRLLHGTSR